MSISCCALAMHSRLALEQHRTRHANLAVLNRLAGAGQVADLVEPLVGAEGLLALRRVDDLLPTVRSGEVAANLRLLVVGHAPAEAGADDPFLQRGHRHCSGGAVVVLDSPEVIERLP